MCLRPWAPEVQGMLLGTETGVPETPGATPSDAEPSATPTLSGAHPARPGLQLSPSSHSTPTLPEARKDCCAQFTDEETEGRDTAGCEAAQLTGGRAGAPAWSPQLSMTLSGLPVCVHHTRGRGPSVLTQRAPTSLTPATGFVEDDFSTDGGREGRMVSGCFKRITFIMLFASIIITSAPPQTIRHY